MFDDIADLLTDNPFSETPVGAKEFVESHEYLGLPPLSKIQYDVVESMAQIYKQEDVERFMGATEGARYYKKYTKGEITLVLGKGSGKDYLSTVAVAYVVYKLLCLKDPSRYYGKPPGDAIDIINIAINAQQARNVFFKGFKNKIERSPWFAGKYYSKMDSIEFKKAITVYSGHSERESHEGLNLFMAVLDEISGFGDNQSNAELGKTGANIYKAFRGTVDSRFPDYGKVVLLSFPRYEGDFISTKYAEAIAEKDVIERTHEFILNPDLPEDYPENKFSIEWEEDHITKYKVPRVFALKRPTWEVNPTRTIEDFKMAFWTDPADARMRFLCTPTISSDAFFRSKEKIMNAMVGRNPLDASRRIDEQWQPDPNITYYLHADLAQKHDKCAVAVAHVEKWVSVAVTDDFKQIVPIVVVDMIAWWEPKKEGPVNLSDVKHWIQGLRRHGANIGVVTFDRWNSLDIQTELRESGMRAETLSVAKKHYEDLAMLVYEDRIMMPSIPLLLEELTELKIIKNNKVDHPRKSCFTGDTLIPLLDGTDQTLESLDGSTVWVYSYDIENDRPVPAQAIVAKTGEAHHLVRVVLDSGAVINCTPDHLFLLRSGVYKEAQHIRPGIDRIMPLNRFWPHNGGYEAISVKGRKEVPHRVRGITHTVYEEPRAIYDLEVPEYHNFALTAGVFVHNSKDLADAMTGAVYNAISRTPRDINPEIEVHSWSSMGEEESAKKDEKPELTQDAKDFLMNFGLL